MPQMLHLNHVERGRCAYKGKGRSVGFLLQACLIEMLCPPAPQCRVMCFFRLVVIKWFIFFFTKADTLQPEAIDHNGAVKDR